MPGQSVMSTQAFRGALIAGKQGGQLVSMAMASILTKITNSPVYRPKVKWACKGLNKWLRNHLLYAYIRDHLCMHAYAYVCSFLYILARKGGLRIRYCSTSAVAVKGMSKPITPTQICCVLPRYAVFFTL